MVKYRRKIMTENKKEKTPKWDDETQERIRHNKKKIQNQEKNREGHKSKYIQ